MQRSKKIRCGVLEAKYRVAGRHAASVEAYFVTTANMPKLRFNCCGWESYEKQAGRVVTYGTINFEKKAYEISMDSGESLVNRRARWPEIPYFIVDVTLVVGDI
jgi:polyribonucleotide nucleotidyltransferase